MPTPHNEAPAGSIAKTVITAGDPKRCEYIAKNYLENPKLVNNIRGMTAYTGTFKGKELTVFPMGMGMPSLGIYAYELYKFYNVETIIRIGTAGTPNENIDILDTVILEGSYTESNYATIVNRDYETHIAYPDKELNKILEETAIEQKIAYKKGYGLCSEVFDVYLDDSKYQDMIDHLPKNIPLKVVEMEAFALFYFAKILNKKAACIVTVVDSRFRPDTIVTSEEREQKLDNMIKIALNASLKI